MKIFISSHGHLASGLKNSIEILLGQCEYITVFDAFLDEHSVQDQLEIFYEMVEEGEQVLLISDLYGGSVNQAMCMYLSHQNTTLVAGVNLAFILGMAGRDSITREELVELVEDSRKMLRIVDMSEIEGMNTSEDDFF